MNTKIMRNTEHKTTNNNNNIENVTQKKVAAISFNYIVIL